MSTVAYENHIAKSYNPQFKTAEEVFEEQRNKDCVDFPDITVSEGEEAATAIRRFLSDDDRALLEELYRCKDA